MLGVLTFYLCFNQTSAAVDSAKFGFFDLSCGISRNSREYYLSRTLVFGKSGTELVYFVLAALHTFLDLDDSRGYLAKALVGKTDDRNVLDLFISAWLIKCRIINLLKKNMMW